MQIILLDDYIHINRLLFVTIHVILKVNNVWCLTLFQMNALGSLLREPNWRNLEEAGRLITVGVYGAGSLKYLKIGVRREISSF